MVDEQVVVAAVDLTERVDVRYLGELSNNLEPQLCRQSVEAHVVVISGVLDRYLGREVD